MAKKTRNTEEGPYSASTSAEPRACSPSSTPSLSLGLGEFRSHPEKGGARRSPPPVGGVRSAVRAAKERGLRCGCCVGARRHDLKRGIVRHSPTWASSRLSFSAKLSKLTAQILRRPRPCDRPLREPDGRAQARHRDRGCPVLWWAGRSCSTGDVPRRDRTRGHLGTTCCTRWTSSEARAGGARQVACAPDRGQPHAGGKASCAKLKKLAGTDVNASPVDLAEAIRKATRRRDLVRSRATLSHCALQPGGLPNPT